MALQRQRLLLGHAARVVPTWTEIAGFWLSVISLIVNVAILAVASWAGVTAVRALRAAEASARAAHDANEQMGRDSKEQTRPYVYAELLPGLAGMHSFDLRVSNAGRSCARELTLSVADWPDADSQHDAGKALDALKVLCDTPRSLPPGCSIRSFWRIEVDNEPPTGMDRDVELTIRYAADDGAEYTDLYLVSSHNAGLWPVPASGPEPSNEPTLRQFYGLGRAIARSIGEISR